MIVAMGTNYQACNMPKGLLLTATTVMKTLGWFPNPPPPSSPILLASTNELAG